jgi:sugar lactone lactonase YvrE
MRGRCCVAGLGAFVAACQPVLGPEDFELTVIADEAAGLAMPQDLAFDPQEDERLWVVNSEDDSVTIVFDPWSAAPETEHLVDPYAEHFMDGVSSIAFGAPGTFGTCQESRNTYNDQAPPNDFMGPALWSSDLEVFATSNPEAVDYLTDLYGVHSDLGSHLDMLHESPNCMGIAWQADNIYWVFDGADGTVVRYDFQHDHGVGYDDHSDGLIGRGPSDMVKRVRGVPSHMALDRGTGLLYVADTGNQRVLVVDTTRVEAGERLPVMEPGTTHFRIEELSFEVLIEEGLEMPSGLELIEDHLVITDRSTGLILVYDLEGKLQQTIDPAVGEDRITGITGRSLNELLFLDGVDGLLYRLIR